jgi:hypothetical protein
MPRPSARLAAFFAVLAGLADTPLPAAVAPPRPRGANATPLAIGTDHARQMAASRELFAARVRALLTDNCLKCHGGGKVRGGLNLSTRDRLLAGSDNGPVAVPGKARTSKLYRLAARLAEPHMPPAGNKPLTPSQIADLARWIDLGAAYDRPLAGKSDPTKKPLVVTAEDRKFWSFQPLRRPAVPAVKSAAARNPIDRFLLAKLEAGGLRFTAGADRRTLIRRLAFDLVGLPPTPAEIDAFVNDRRPDAWERLVDRLLASPAHGERWARHWLDVVRWAESHGFEHDTDRPTAYPYRDFVIRALNLDLPYTTFVRWQIAGDELAPDDRLALAATGFLGAGVHSTQITANTVEKERYDELDDIVRTMGTAMLGLTVGCARCHDHKYDPIPTRDYYRLVSTFTTTVRCEVDLESDPEQARAAREVFAAQEKALAARLAQQRPQGPEWRKLNEQLAALRRKGPAVAKYRAMICSEGLKPLRLHSQGADFLEQTHFLQRGDPNQKNGIATPSFLQVLMRHPDGERPWREAPPKGWRTSYRRRSLANWMVDVEHGAGHLLARVIVNRLWQHHFGRGIVNTPSDFGLQGERPTHPELLDWLAGELIAQGWRLKPIHRLIVTSAAYRQAATFDRGRAAVDPDNRLLWRRAPRRLEAEVIRDALLAVAGQIDRRMFGPGSLEPDYRRRSVYLFVKRSRLVPMMVLFDAPDGTVGIESRTSTTIAPQALLLMNNPVVRAAARAFAARLRGLSDAEAVRRGYTLAVGRSPRAAEQTEATAFLAEQRDSYREEKKADADLLALTDFCQALLGLNEFVYVD